MTCRFPNEGGILGPTALPTVLRACLEGTGEPVRHASARRARRLAPGRRMRTAIAYVGDQTHPDRDAAQWLGRTRAR